jgi:protein-S-isoprenylcysteine O-methyltransferase Ste14
MLRKIASVLYGAGAYLLFLGAFLYLMAFATNLARHSVSGDASLPPLWAALVDIALITLFGLQHGIMARPEFKRRWTRLVPRHLERSTFVWFAAALVIIIVQFWQPIEGDLWNVTGVGMIALYAISLLGFLTVPVVSFLTDHFELFGLRQVFEYALGRPMSKPEFKERALYRKVRHPMMLGFLIAFLGHSPHDREPFAVRNSDDVLHCDRHLLRGARSGARARPGVSRVPGTGAKAVAVWCATQRTASSAGDQSRRGAEAFMKGAELI